MTGVTKNGACVDTDVDVQGGNVWEKAGVNVSVVYGSMPPEAYRAATGTTKTLGNENGAQVHYSRAEQCCSQGHTCITQVAA